MIWQEEGWVFVEGACPWCMWNEDLLNQTHRHSVLPDGTLGVVVEALPPDYGDRFRP